METKLLRRDVHEIDRLRIDLEEVAAVAHGDLADEVALLVDLGVGLGDDLALLLIGGEVFRSSRSRGRLCRRGTASR